MTKQKIEKAKNIFFKHGPILKTVQLKNQKFHSREIAELSEKGYINKLKTGYYIWADTEKDLSDHALACGLIPNGVIYLNSAAAFYDLATVNPASITMAIPPRNINIKKPDYPPIELYPIYRNFALGIKEINDNGIMRIYNKERTVCDFFKNKNKVGNDIALEVIKSYMNQKSKNIQKLMEYAAIITDKRAMMAYVEALI